jgi:hypothetical protein
MTTAYPNNLDNFSNPLNSDTQNSSTVPHAQQHANANDAIEAIEAELGLNPSGLSLDVKSRLTAIEASIVALGDSAFSSLPDGSISTVKLANNAVTSAKIIADAVGSTQIAANAVTASKIANNSITFAKLSGLMITVVCTSSTRPGSPVIGQEIFETDTLRSLIYNGTAWVIVSQLGAWTQWTPTWTGLAAGNGVYSRRHWIRHGTMIHGELSFTLGSTSSISGPITFSLPPAVAAASTAGIPMGNAIMIDVSAGVDAHAEVRVSSGQLTGNIVCFNSSTTYLQATQATSNIPFIWASGDLIIASFWYETT